MKVNASTHTTIEVMTDPIAAPSSLQPQCFSEVYCTDLPSACNLYLSGKRCIKRCIAEDDKSKTNDTKSPSANVPIMRYATERHSITLMQKDNNERGDGYSLSTIRLDSKQNNEKEKVENNNVDVCLAHSSISWEDDASMDDYSSLEVFAMMRNTSDVQTTDDTTDNNTLADVGMKDSTTAAGDGTSEQKSTEASAVSIKPSPLKNETDNGGDIPSQYYLKVKSTRMKSNIETIPLDFRPIAVHLAELYISKDSDNNDTTCFGIFVASVDDNMLRLYVTTKDALENRVNKHGRNDTCFVSVSLNDVSESEVQVEDDLDEGMNDPLTLSTPIMAIDTCLTKGESGDMRLNRLALACYDGTVRILAYQLKAQQKQENIRNGDHDNVPTLQFCHVRCSSFIIDGPVVSLHFGTSFSANPNLPQIPSLFLVAGSLCGFACIFYESLMPNNEGNSARFFNGPTTLVDGLYDAQQEGYEDSVTTVHIGCVAGKNQMIVVGTQGGRVLLFQQCQEERAIWEGRLITVQKEQCELESQIDQNKNEISRLQSEKEVMDSNEVDLSASISEMQCKLEDLSKEINTIHTERCEPPDKVDDPKEGECLDESTSIERDPEPTQKDLNTSPDAQSINEMSTLRTKIEAAQTELTSLQCKQQTNVLKITELTSETDDCMRKVEQNKRKLDEYKLHPGRYRYKLLYEYHLPYPIHGTSCTYCDESKRQEIFVTTRRSFHVFQYSPEI